MLSNSEVVISPVTEGQLFVFDVLITYQILPKKISPEIINREMDIQFIMRFHTSLSFSMQLIKNLYRLTKTNYDRFFI
jgi:hypothetical protein